MGVLHKARFPMGDKVLPAFLELSFCKLNVTVCVDCSQLTRTADAASSPGFCADLAADLASMLTSLGCKARAGYAAFNGQSSNWDYWDHGQKAPNMKKLRQMYSYAKHSLFVY